MTQMLQIFTDERKGKRQTAEGKRMGIRICVNLWLFVLPVEISVVCVHP